MNDLRHLVDFCRLGQMRLEDAGSGVWRSWVPCFPQGKFQHPDYGLLDFSQPSLQLYIDHFYQRVRKIDIAVDVDHKQEQAVGWLKEMQYRSPVGLFALVEWNRLGAQLLADKRYRYISPQFGEYVDEETGQTYPNTLTCLTLTNFPFLKKMPAVSLSEPRLSRCHPSPLERLVRAELRRA